MPRVAVSCALLAVLLAACGDEEPRYGDKRGEPPPGPIPPQRSAAAPEEDCDEVTDLEIAFGAEKQPVEDFEVTHTRGFIAGMRYEGERTAKLVHIVLANYEPDISTYDVSPPTEEGQVAILLTFKTDSVAVAAEKQREAYAEMVVPTGTYKPGWMQSEATFQVAYYLGGAMSAPAISGGATGEATLTHSSPRLVCGRIDFKSPSGTTIRGTFSVEIAEDKWMR